MPFLSLEWNKTEFCNQQKSPFEKQDNELAMREKVASFR